MTAQNKAFLDKFNKEIDKKAEKIKNFAKTTTKSLDDMKLEKMIEKPNTRTMNKRLIEQIEKQTQKSN